MTKKQMIRELRDVIDGTDIHAFALVEKNKKGWKIETSCCKIFPDTLEWNQRTFQHSCNKITLKEVELLVNYAFN